MRRKKNYINVRVCLPEATYNKYFHMFWLLTSFFFLICINYLCVLFSYFDDVKPRKVIDFVQVSNENGKSMEILERIISMLLSTINLTNFDDLSFLDVLFENNFSNISLRRCIHSMYLMLLMETFSYRFHCCGVSSCIKKLQSEGREWSCL